MFCKKGHGVEWDWRSMMEKWEYLYLVTQRFGREAWIINHDFIVGDVFEVDRTYPPEEFERRKIDITGEGVWHCYPADHKAGVLGKSVIEALNVLGDQGWELVSVNRSNYEHYYYFRRPKA